MINDNEVQGLWKDDVGECLLRVIGIHRTGGGYNYRTEGTKFVKVRFDVNVIQGCLTLDRIFRCILPKRSGTNMMIECIGKDRSLPLGDAITITVRLNVPNMPNIQNMPKRLVPKNSVGELGWW